MNEQIPSNVHGGAGNDTITQRAVRIHFNDPLAKDVVLGESVAGLAGC